MYVSNRTYKHLPPEQTGILDSGATHIYIAPNALYEKMDTTGKHIRVGTANGQVANSTAMATLTIPQIKADFPTKGYIMPTFTNTLIGVGPICDADCAVVFKKEDVTVLSPKGEPILQGWREDKLPRLWRVALSSDKNRKESTQQQARTDQRQVMLMIDLAWKH